MQVQASFWRVSLRLQWALCGQRTYSAVCPPPIETTPVKTFITAGLLVLAAQLAACMTIADLTETRDGARFRVGDRASARVGDVMLDRYRYATEPTAKPRSEIAAAPGRYALRAGYPLVARRVDGEAAYCTPPQASSVACFYDRDGDSAFDHDWVSNWGVASSVRPLPVPEPYDKVDSRMARGFKSELIYLGLNGQVIQLRYQDYTDDLSAPSYTQPLQVRLDTAPAVTEIRYRDALLRVLEADATQIRYQIISGFSE